MDNITEEQIQVAQQLQFLEKTAKQKMSKETISRYGNLKIAHPEIAIKVITAIAHAVQAGQIREIINDEQFKMLLKEMQQKRI